MEYDQKTTDVSHFFRGVYLSILEASFIVARATQSWDLGDKIYGIIGLVAKFQRNESKNLLQMDYELPVVELYTIVGSTLLEDTLDLLLLSRVEDALDRRIHGLPSWVPDFSVPYSTDTMLDPTGKVYDASLAVRNSSVRACHIENHDLYVNGAQRSSIFELCKTTNETIRSGLTHELVDLCSKADSVYTNGQSQWETLWRTLIADQVNGSCPAPLQFAKHLHNLLLNDAKCALQEAKESESDFARLHSRYQSWELFAQ